MKKILYLFPILLICTSCSKAPKQQNYEIPENNDIIIASPQENIENSPETLPSIEIQSTTDPITRETISPEPTISPSNSPSLPPKETSNTKTPEPSPIEEPESGNEIGNIALDFSSKTLENLDIKLSDYRGKTIFLNFWASWCGPCVRELPSIQKVHDTNEDVVVLTVNCGDNISDIKNFMEKNNYNFNVIPDESGIISHLYYTDYIPLTLIIDENGIIKERHVGLLTEENMLKLINKGEN